jgi:hypothetical protein
MSMRLTRILCQRVLRVDFFWEPDPIRWVILLCRRPDIMGDWRRLKQPERLNHGGSRTIPYAESWDR